MANTVESGLTIATAGLTTYCALYWLQESAVTMYAKLAIMLPAL
jgi:hypothetical protein